MGTEHSSRLGSGETRGTAPQTGGSPFLAAVRRWFMWIGYAYLALSGWVRMAYAIGSWGWLQFAGLRPGPLYLAITGGVWGMTGLAALVWMILRRPGYRLVGMGAALLFALTYWADRLFVATRTSASGNIIFAVLITILGLAYAALMLWPFGTFKIKKETTDERR